MINNSDTIAAVATAPGVGGIGIVRISGPLALSIATALFRPPKPLNHLPIADLPQKPRHFSHRKVQYGHLVDPHHGTIIDEVLLLYMRAPHSYTREDVVEIQSHAGIAVLQQILRLVRAHGARLAEPGEFTRRAFLNGRIDLSQAEAVADLISAKTDQALTLATQMLTGGLKARIGQVRAELELAAGNLEAMIEFPEDLEDEEVDRLKIDVNLRKTLEDIDQLLRAHKDLHIFREGIQVSVIGRTNVGKSSLMNALLEKERAIVTELPGTTRDVVTDTFRKNGIPIQIADTAGIRPSDDPVEKIGIQKTEESIATAQLILFVQDCSDLDHPEDAEIYAKIAAKKVLVVQNKSDLMPAPVPLPNWLNDTRPRIPVSAKFQKNIEDLKKMIVDLAIGEVGTQVAEGVVPNLRQKTALEKTSEEVKNAILANTENRTEELIVFHLQSALNSLGTITGETYDDELLDIIFERFCIGK
jgi:tRNA modification GTPase